MKRYILSFITIIFLIFNTGCGDESPKAKGTTQGNTNNNTTNNNTINNDTNDTTNRKYEIKGVVHANYVNGATIKLYGVEDNNSKTINPLASAQSDSNGSYSFIFINGIPKYKAYIIEASGGTYTDEETNQEKSLDSVMSSITYDISEESNSSISAITPATDLIVKILKKSNKFDKGKRDEIASQVSIKLLGQISSMDFFKTLPVDMENQEELRESSKDQRVYSMLMRGFSKTSKDTNKSVEDVNMELMEAIDQNRTNSLMTAQMRSSLRSSIASQQALGVDTGVDENLSQIEAEQNRTIKQYVQNYIYEENDKVMNNGKTYQCISSLYSGLCSNVIYEPGVSILWTSAWRLLEDTEVTSELSNARIALKWKNKKYLAGDLIFYKGEAYECKSWPFTGWCSVRESGTIGWLQAWAKYDGAFSVDNSELTDQDRYDYESKLETATSNNLEKPSIMIEDLGAKYTLMVRTSFSNENNRPSGYIIYKDDQNLTTGEWQADEDTSIFLTFDKDSSTHTYYVKTYQNIVSRTGSSIKTSISSDVKSVLALNTIDTSDVKINQKQSILLLSKMSIKVNIENDNTDVYSDIIQVTGGDGDGEVIFDIEDNNIIGIQKIWNSDDFIVIAKKEGLSVINIYKEKSSDNKYIKSQIFKFHVEVTKISDNIDDSASSNKVPGLPSISLWQSKKIKNGEMYTVLWNKWSGFSAKTMKLFIDDQEISSESLTDFVPDVQGAQKGWITIPINNNVGATSTHKFYIELCNQDKCTKSISKEFQYLSIDNSPQDPNPNPNPNPNTVGTLPIYIPPSTHNKSVKMLSPAAHVPSYLKGSNKNEVTAYFGQWKIYGRKYEIKDIPANKLTGLNYGFVGVKVDGTLYTLDKYADFGRTFTGTNSDYNGPNYSYSDEENRTNTVGYINKDSLKLIPNLNFNNGGSVLYKGNFKEMMLLKVKYPHIEIYPSVGGWTKSDEIYTMANNAVARTAFANNCVEFARKHGFDGIDLDWEFPVKGGSSSDSASDFDRDNFVLLMTELRNAIDSDSYIGEISTIYPKLVYSQDNLDGIEHPNYINKKLKLTIAVYSGVEAQDKAGVNYELVKDLVDMINIMSYDYHGSWEAGGANGRTGHQSGLFNNNDHISEYFNTSSSYNKVLRNHDYNSNVDVVDSHKISVGLALYGRIAAEVSSDANNGLGQLFSSTILGTFEKGNADYFDIKDRFLSKNGFIRYWDKIAKVPYLYNSAMKMFITYEDKLSMSLKAAYFVHKKNSHVFFWELSSDTQESKTINVKGVDYIVPKAGDLLSAVHEGIADLNYYDKYKDVETYEEVSMSPEDIEKMTETSLIYNIKSVYSKIENFKLGDDYKLLLDIVNKLDNYVPDTTNMDSKIADAKIKLVGFTILENSNTDIKVKIEKYEKLKSDFDSVLIELIEESKILVSQAELEELKQADLIQKKQDFNTSLTRLKGFNVQNIIPHNFTIIANSISAFLNTDLFKSDDYNSTIIDIINIQKNRLNSFLSPIKVNFNAQLNNRYPNVKDNISDDFSEANILLINDRISQILLLKQDIINEDIEVVKQFISLKNYIINEISNAKNISDEERARIKDQENRQDYNRTNINGGGTPTTTSTSKKEIDLNRFFNIEIVKFGWGGISITLTTKTNKEFNLRDAELYLQLLEKNDPQLNIDNVSWSKPKVDYSIDNDLVIAKLTLNNFLDEESVDTIFGGKIGEEIIIKVWNAQANSSLGDTFNDIKIIKIIEGQNKANTVGTETESGSANIGVKPQRANPISLKVKGWPSSLAMGTVTDNDNNLNNKFKESKIDSIFKYAGDGFGNRGEVIEPIPTMKTIAQARKIEALDSTGKTKIMPTIVVYTANSSGGGLAPDDIKTNYSINNWEINTTNTILENSNLVKHFRNTIRMAVQIQSNVDNNHPNPATIVLNADLFGEWQKNKLNGTFQNEYCGGATDLNCDTFKVISIREAMLKAIDLEEDYMVQKYDENGISKNNIKLSDVGYIKDVLGTDELMNTSSLSQIKSKITQNIISNDIKGWVQSQNFIIKEFAPNVPFGWVINLWNPGSAHWVHKQYAGERKLWEKASGTVATFTKWIGAYDDNDYRPDFLTFDKYERDGLGAAGKPSYAFSSRAWDNYLMYVKHITDFIDTPAMLWQIPGGHMVSKTENLSGDSILCTDNEEHSCFRHLDTDKYGGHSATGGTYFMGDKKIGSDPKNTIIDDVLKISILGSHYNGATNLEGLLEQTNHNLGYDWGKSKLRHAVFSNVFAILWGGGETTGSVPISTNKTGGYNWLKNKIVEYKKYPIPLYHKDEVSVQNTNGQITQINSFNNFLTDKTTEDSINKYVFAFEYNANKWSSDDNAQPSYEDVWKDFIIYKWKDFLDGLVSMHNTGIANDKYWLYPIDASGTKIGNDETNTKYAKVAIAAFLSQTMQETIRFNACDENSWQFLKDATSGEHQNVTESYERGDFEVSLPMDASCGQLGQNYNEYGVDEYGKDNPYSCPRTPMMEVTAITNAPYYGASGPLMSAPNSVFEDLGLLVDGKPGRWEWASHSNGSTVAFGDDTYPVPTLEAWLRPKYQAYSNQRAGSYVWDGSSKRSLQGCSWWGRGVIQTTGRENFGKLNHFVGRSHIDPELIKTDVSWADGKVYVEEAPANPLYANLDLCSNPELICSSTDHKEMKWIAGLFFWMNSVQAYDVDTGKYKDWNYQTELKKYVDSDFGKNNYQPLNDISFIDSVSGIVNRGCPDETCPVSGKLDAKTERKENFVQVLKYLGIENIQ